MRIVMISTCNAVAQYIIRHVHAQAEVAHVLKVEMQYGSHDSWWQRLRPGRILQGLERRWFYNPMLARHEEQLKQLLEPDDDLAMPPITQIDSRYLNSKSTAEAIKELDPDLLLVCFAPVLKPIIFSLPKLATLNIHFGIAPTYRGENTLFWPRYYNDLKHLGVTLHHIDRGIDTGTVLARAFLKAGMCDTEVAIQQAAAQAAAEITCYTITYYDFRAPTVASELPAGRLYLRRHRRVWHDLSVAAQQGRSSASEGPLDWEPHFYWKSGTSADFPRRHPRKSY